MLTERSPTDSIFYVGNGPRIKHAVSDGDAVTLRSGDQRILVRDVAQLSPGLFTGTIYGFEPSMTTDYKGLKLGQKLEFSERHIFGCTAA